MARLAAYRARLVLAPQKGAAQNNIAVPVVTPAPTDLLRKSVGEPTPAYSVLRKARSDARLVGVRAMRAKALAEEEAQKKK